jgi:hypothetical protein
VSKTGFIVNCGNKVTRIVYPGLLILSLDMQEAWDYLGACAAGANYPFPGCLCPRCHALAVTGMWEIRC